MLLRKPCLIRFAFVLFLLTLGNLPTSTNASDSDTTSTMRRGTLDVRPPSISFDRPESSVQLVVSEMRERSRDVTRGVSFSVDPPGVIQIDRRGVVRPVGDGVAKITVEAGEENAIVQVSVRGFATPPPVSFANEIMPILTKSRCNSGGCHGKAEGQNGFKLSLLGFGVSQDYDAIVKEGKGRRISISDPSSSLLLLKGSAELPHGGGMKFEPGSSSFHKLRRWIASGAPLSIPADSPIERIVVRPSELQLLDGEQQQLQVIAIDSQGVERCVTQESDYISNAAHVVQADPFGLLSTTDTAGEAAILVRYLGHVTVCRVTRPRPNPSFVRPPENNFVDTLVWNKLSKLGIQPSDLADDATFLRRVYLDTIGTLPTASESRQFLTSTSPSKRRELIDSLLNRPEYAEYWAMKWSDILRADKIKVTAQGTVGLTRWLHTQFATNRPYDQMVREILTAQGPVQSESPAAFFKSLDQPEIASRAISQLFLGVRIECAQCHHHPSERWGQDDYAGFAGFFTGVSTKKLPDGVDAIVAKAGTDQKHPRTGELVPARALGSASAKFDGAIDRRKVLADWVVDEHNPFFARAIANRTWAHYLGRGLVEPIDDMRVTNPATDEQLLDALAAKFRESKYDLKELTRNILNSRTYQLNSTVNDFNRQDVQHFSHALPKTMPAEVLLDAICQTTGVPEKFNGWPLGVRSIQVWDNRMPSYFFRIFGRPVRATVCECERSNEPSISQALHLLNSPEINAKISHRAGLARRLADSTLSPDEITDEIYLGTVNRFPRDDERQFLRTLLRPSDNSDSSANVGPERQMIRREAVEDLLWAVLNTKEFLYN